MSRAASSEAPVARIAQTTARCTISAIGNRDRAVAGLAVIAAMFFSVALHALRRGIAIDPNHPAQGILLFLVALLAGHVAMRHVQSESCAVVIEDVRSPLRGPMTTRALFFPAFAAELTSVNVLRGVAG